MIKFTLLLLWSTLLYKLAFSQSYDAYFTGNPLDSVATPSRGVCLMGGASEDDNAMKWFLERTDGGDVLVLRASGSDGYNNYLYNELGIAINSVETIVFNNPLAAEDPYIHDRIQQAEGIWFAGGDQWDYISYWRNSAIDSLINDAIEERNIVIGGTSAGMAIQGKFYFSAQYGTVTSPTALANPFDNNITVDSLSFIANNYLADVITDTHYDNPDRKGRSIVFLSRILLDYGIAGKVIACDEYTAVCIDESGMAKVFGQHPDYDDNAYFIQTNCALDSILPENCTPDNPLDWNLGNAATSVYTVKGTSSGANSFDLADWKTGNGGIWEHWFVDNGVLSQVEGLEPDCATTSVPSVHQATVTVYPNPADNYVLVQMDAFSNAAESIQPLNSMGQVVRTDSDPIPNTVRINTNDLPAGMYFINLSLADGTFIKHKLILL